MSKVYHVTVTNPNTDNPMMGTLSFTNRYEFDEKLRQCCKSHFDADIDIPSILPFEWDQIDSRGETLIILVDGEEDEVFIEQTWLY